MSYNRLLPRSEQQVIVNDIATTLKLEVVEAYDRKDVGKGIVRVNYDVMRSLGIRIGDIIEISGKQNSTAAIFMPLDSTREKENKHIVGIDRLTRYNARVATGEFVTISKTNAIVAYKITMKPLTAMAIGKSLAIDERYLRYALTNVPIRPMDVVVIPYFKTGLAFKVIDIISFNGNYNYVASSAFMVSTNTKFEIIY